MSSDFQSLPFESKYWPSKIYSDVYTHHFNKVGIRVIYPDKIFQDIVGLLLTNP